MAQPPKIYNSGPLNSVWNYTIDQVKKFAKVLGPYLKFGEVGDTDFPLVPSSIGPKVSFRKPNYSNAVDVIIPGVLEITRGNNGGIYNSAVEPNWNDTQSPLNTEWNGKNMLSNSNNNPIPQDNGWAYACNAPNLNYVKFYNVLGYNWYNPRGLVDQNVQLIMHEKTSDRYWLIQFTSWTGGGYGGGFAYDRWEIFHKVDFVRPPLQLDVVDVITPGKTIIKRLNDSYGVFNAAVENSYAGSLSGNAWPKSPTGTLWNSINIDPRPGYNGWDNLTNIKNRIYSNWYEAIGNPTALPSAQLIMLDQATNNYYTVQFTNWDNGTGEFSYTRRLIPMTKSVNFGSGVNSGQGGAIDYPYVHNLEYNDNKIKTITTFGTYTLSSVDRGVTLIFTNISQISVTQMNVPIGTQVDIINNTSGGLIISPGVGVTINSYTGATTMADQYTAATLIYTDVDTWTLIGKLS